MKTLLWIDDYRNPFENNWLVFSPLQQPYNVVWVKTWNAFKKYIEANGIPDAVCFDHDLGGNKSGYDCAKFIVEYCMDHNVPAPLYNMQSANPVGKRNIHMLFKNFKKHYEQPVNKINLLK